MNLIIGAEIIEVQKKNLKKRKVPKIRSTIRKKNRMMKKKRWI
jgi:hypothetical protein